jgi:hypothetical protein
MVATKHEITPANLKFDRNTILGSGGAGNVYKGSLRVTSGQRDVAVKVLDDAGPDGPPREYTLLRKAAEKCSHVCKPLGYCIKEKKTCLVLTLYDKSLLDYLQEQPGVLLYSMDLHGLSVDGSIQIHI